MNFGGSVYISVTEFTKCEIILFLASMEGPEKSVLLSSHFLIPLKITNW